MYAQGLVPQPAGITKVRTADDTDAQLLGYVKVHLQIGAYTDRVTLLVMARQLEGVDILLATDWMQARRVDQSFKDGVVRCWKGGKQFLLRPREQASQKAVQQGVINALQAHPKDKLIKSISAKRALRAIAYGATALMVRVQTRPITSEPGLAAVAPQPGEATDGTPAPGVQKLLAAYADVFQDLQGLPPEREVVHSIPLLEGSRLPHKRMYRLSPREKEEVEKQVKQLLEMGLIRPSASPFGAPVLFVDKPDGSLRMCLDYRALNEITVKRRFPMPNMEELFDQLSGAKIFSSLDLQQGYYQIRIPEADVPKTAFMTHLGQFEYLVLCMGLTNAPATFQETMNKVFAPHLRKFVLVYLDDILVYSKTPEEHMLHLKQVLETLRQHKLYAKLKKCDFFRTHVKFLGHIVGADGLRVDPSEVEAAQKWPVPQTVAQLRSFLGLANYFRKFIQGYSSMAAPLTALTAAKVPWEWTKECQQAFEDIKTALTNAPVLALPDPNKPFVIISDASIYGTGGILMQEDRVVAYLSHKFDSAQKNYSTTDQECLGVIHALTEWRCYVEGTEVTLVTDHQPLTYLQSLSATAPLSRRHARWMELLSRFHFKWLYRKGTLNGGIPATISAQNGLAATNQGRLRARPCACF